MPCPPNAMGQKDFAITYEAIMDFINAKKAPFDKGNPIVFTYANFEDENDTQIRVLESFMDQFSHGAHKIDLIPVNLLVLVLIKELVAQNRCEDIPSETYIRTMLSYDPYDTTGKICCQVIVLCLIFSELFCNQM